MTSLKGTLKKRLIIPSGMLLSLSLLLSSCNNLSDNRPPLNSLLDIGFMPEQESPAGDVSYHKKIDQKLNSNSLTHYGLDISHYQGSLMEEIQPKDSVKFIICKATQGSDFVDPDFRYNWREIQFKGFIRGTYHFYDCSADPVVQANHFARTVGEIEATNIAPILDIEQGSMTPDVTAKRMEEDILKFLKHVEKKLGRKPIIYTNYEFAQQNLTDPVFSDYKLWLAEYNNQVQPLVPDLWKNKGFDIWQKSPSYSAFSEKMDMDIRFGSLKALVQ